MKWSQEFTGRNRPWGGGRKHWRSGDLSQSESESDERDRLAEIGRPGKKHGPTGSVAVEPVGPITLSMDTGEIDPTQGFPAGKPCVNVVSLVGRV